MANPPESLSSKFDAVTAQLIELNSKVATLFAPPVLTVSLTTSLTAALTTVLKTPVLTVALTTAFTTALAATRAVSPPRAVLSPAALNSVSPLPPAALNSVSPLPPAALNSVSPLPPAIDLVSVALVELTKAALDLDAAMKAAASPTATAADKAAVTVATTALAAATTAVRTAATPAPQPLDLVSNALGDVTTAVAATAAAALTTQISAVLPAELTAALESLTKAAEAAAAATAAVGSASPTQMPGAMAALTAAAEAAATATAAATAETAVFTANMSAAYSTIIPSLDQVTNSLVDVTAAAAKLKEGTAALAAEQAAAAAAAAAAPAVTDNRNTSTRKQEEAFKSMMGQIQSYLPNFMAVANSLDNIQRRALASNTTLSEVSRLASKELGVLVTDLSAEILSLRESGIRELNDSTISLIARMKRTDQSTAALGVFLSLNSAKLAINSTEAQKLAVSMLESARKYGVSESKALETANDTSQHLGLLPTLNLAKNALQGATNYKTSMGNTGGISEAANKLSDLLSSGDATKQAMFGIQREVQAFTKGTPDQAEEALRSSARKIDSFIQGQIGPNKDPITASILIENFGGADFTNAMRALVTQSKLTPSVSDVDTLDSLKAFTTEIRALVELGIQPFYFILTSITGFLQNLPIIKQFTAFVLVTGSIIFAGYQLITAFSLLHKLVALTNIQLGRNLALGSAQQVGAMGNAAASMGRVAGFLGKLSGPLTIAVVGLQAASLILNKQQQIRDHTKESMIEMKQKKDKLAQQEQDTMSPLSQILRRQVRQALDNQTAEDKDNKSMKDQNSLLEQIRDAVRVKERIPVSKQTGRSSR